MDQSGLDRRDPDGSGLDESGLDWRDGVPVSRRFDDPYYSLAGGLAETRHVFLAGTGLPERARAGFTVLELGFGTGLNALTLAHDLAAAGVAGPVRVVTCELDPMPRHLRARALAAFPEIAAEAAALDAAMAGAAPWRVGPVEITLLAGDARATLPRWDGMADAVFLDGFAPAKNSEMWEPALLAAVAARMVRGARLATYTAAGSVRRALAEAGLTVERRAGYGRKRHMTVAWRL